ncbi:MAG: transposase [Streptococcaceae bacterium]|nr:transposase [Streptococcaceae bacterium]
MAYVKEQLEAKGHKVYPHRIKEYAGHMGLSVHTTKKVINASTPAKCKERLEDAIKLDKSFENCYEDWNQDCGARIYFYDQSNMNQYKVMDDKVLAPPGMVIYEKYRETSMTASATLHMICDQYGEVFVSRIEEGGVGLAEIQDFLEHASDRLPVDKKRKKGEKVKIYMDHLGSHKSLRAKGVGHWDIALTPLSCPDANPVEFLFSSFKAHLRKKTYNLKTLKIDDWKKYVKKEFEGWHKVYKADSGIFEHCREVVKEVIKAKGDLQQLQFNQWGYESIEDFQNSSSYEC